MAHHSWKMLGPPKYNIDTQPCLVDYDTGLDTHPGQNQRGDKSDVL